MNSSKPKDIRIKPEIRLNVSENADVMQSIFNAITACRKATLSGALDANSNCTDSENPSHGVSGDPNDLAYYLKPYDHSNYPASSEIQPGPNFKTVEVMTDFIRKNSSFGHHGSGTCQMGINDTNSVVNALGQVHGVKCLRICDTSIANEQSFHMYNTSMGAYILAERMADLVIDEITLE